MKAPTQGSETASNDDLMKTKLHIVVILCCNKQTKIARLTDRHVQREREREREREKERERERERERGRCKETQIRR